MPNPEGDVTNGAAASWRLFTISQAAAELNCSPRTVWRLVSSGALRLVRLGRAARITRASIEEFIAKGGER